jgi:hypothetical protein
MRCLSRLRSASRDKTVGQSCLSGSRTISRMMARRGNEVVESFTYSLMYSRCAHGTDLNLPARGNSRKKR